MINKIVFENDAMSPFARGYFSLVKTAGWIDVQLKEALKPYDITHAQLNVLNVLAKNYPEPMNAKTIKENLIVASPDLTRLLDRLVKKELVDRQTCLENRRKIDITVTKKGIKLFYKLHRVAKKSVNNFFEDSISVDEAKRLHRILKKISD